MGASFESLTRSFLASRCVLIFVEQKTIPEENLVFPDVLRERHQKERL